MTSDGDKDQRRKGTATWTTFMKIWGGGLSTLPQILESRFDSLLISGVRLLQLQGCPEHQIHFLFITTATGYLHSLCLALYDVNTAVERGPGAPPPDVVLPLNQQECALPQYSRLPLTCSGSAVTENSHLHESDSPFLMHHFKESVIAQAFCRINNRFTG